MIIVYITYVILYIRLHIKCKIKNTLHPNFYVYPKITIILILNMYEFSFMKSLMYTSRTITKLNWEFSFEMKHKQYH